MAVDPNAPIWRYFDLAKYVGLLARGLFFARPSALRASDPWEGSWGAVDFTESLDATVHASPDGVTNWRDELRERQTRQDAFGVSSWHESSTESAALWQIYSPLGFGVAVKSTPARVQAALGARRVEVRRMDYGGHEGRRLGSDPLVLLSTKRPEFKHEAELRFFATLAPDELAVLKAVYADIEDHGKFRRIKPGHKGVLIVPGVGFASKDPTCVDRGAPAGVHLPTAVSTLVERVHLVPGCAYSLRRAVVDVTARFGLPHAIVRESAMDVAPYDRVVFDVNGREDR